MKGTAQHEAMTPAHTNPSTTSQSDLAGQRAGRGNVESPRRKGPGFHSGLVCGVHAQALGAAGAGGVARGAA